MADGAMADGGAGGSARRLRGSRGAARWSRAIQSALAAVIAVAALAAGPAPPAGAVEWGATLADFLPAGAEHDPVVPAPAAVLGHEVGERHVRPDDLVRYFEALAETSDRVRLEIQGRTHEGRPQPLAIVTSPANHARLEEIRRAHLALSDPAAPEPADGTLDAMPAVVWLGYSIHGNEASGANAAPAVAYHLAAGRGPEVAELLDRLVVLIDPSLNPDGLGRFAQWVNSHRGTHPVADPADREHSEPWPGGRGNHYWFDLNRDWLLAQHPETRNRLATLRRWRPNLLGDYHEMGSEATYFFQPGVPSRQNPLTPPENLELTRRVAAFHARALDRAGRLYYTEETFDDFYPGKGSTYPDLTGAVGVLFEQASARGHRRETDRGGISLPFAVHNQVLTSFSMLEAAAEMRRDLLSYQRRFAVTALDEAKADPVGGWVFSAPSDPARGHLLLEHLAAHGIEVRRLARTVEADGWRFQPDSAWVVAADQPQYRLIRALFETRTEFADSTFYDVSTWTLPQAYGLPSAELGPRRFEPGLLGERVTVAAPAGSDPAAIPAGRLPPAAAGAPPPYAWLFEWSGYFAPRALHRLLAGDFSAEVATVPFEAVTDAGRRRFGAGTVVVPAPLDDERRGELSELLAHIAAEDGVDVWSVASGLTVSGIDLGSPRVRTAVEPAPALLVGDGTSPYEAGEAWHLLDHRFGIPVSLLERDRVARTDLDRYTHLLMVDGDWSRLPEEATRAIRRWIEDGGVLVAQQRAAQWAETALLDPPAGGTGAPASPHPPASGAPSGSATTSGGAIVTTVSPGITPGGGAAAGGQSSSSRSAYVPPLRDRPPFAEYETARAAETVSGAIFRLELDVTHPLAFGLGAPELPVFRDSTLLLAASANPFENVARYADRPLISGYASERRAKEIAGTAAVTATRLGEGTVIRFADDLNFRGFWLGTQKMYLNALFFGGMIQRTEAPERWR